MAGDVAIEGLPELHRSLAGLDHDLRDMSGLNRSAAGELVKALAVTAPKVTGRLAGSFTASGTQREAVAESALIYAPVIDNGWGAHNIEAQHYSEQALAASSSAVTSKYQEGVDRMVKKAES